MFTVYIAEYVTFVKYSDIEYKYKIVCSLIPKSIFSKGFCFSFRLQFVLKFKRLELYCTQSYLTVMKKSMFF